jgi:hypothetical protein
MVSSRPSCLPSGRAKLASTDVAGETVASLVRASALSFSSDEIKAIPGSFDPRWSFSFIVFLSRDLLAASARAILLVRGAVGCMVANRGRGTDQL